jgi:hypothetical protein
MAAASANRVTITAELRSRGAVDLMFIEHACSVWSVLHPTSERKFHMIHEEKVTRSVKLNKEELSEAIVNDSLGEVTPADSTGLDSKDEHHKRERPA